MSRFVWTFLNSSKNSISKLINLYKISLKEFALKKSNDSYGGYYYKSKYLALKNSLSFLKKYKSL